MHKFLSLSEIKNIYNKYQVRASKRFGQNFLINQGVLENIVSLHNFKEEEVIEIGPGMGSLTRILLNEKAKVIAYEIDRSMIKVLENELKDPHLKVIEENFLNINPDWKGRKVLVGNIPYNITSEILFKLFKLNSFFSQAILMVQKEVADRLSAKVGTSKYSKLTVSTMHFCEVEKEFDVSPNSFFPAPKVTSSVITLKFKKINFEESKEFLNFVKCSFSMRRKTILNNFKQFLSNEEINNIFSKTGIMPENRPQEISYESYIKAFNIVK